MLFGRPLVYITKRSWSWSWDVKSWSWTLGLVLVLVLKKVLITSMPPSLSYSSRCTMLAFIYIYASNFNRKMTFNPSKVILLVCSINILLPAGLREAQTTGIKFTHRPKIRSIAPQGRLITPIRVKLGVADGQVPSGSACLDKISPQSLRGGNPVPKYQKFPLLVKDRRPCPISKSFIWFYVYHYYAKEFQI